MKGSLSDMIKELEPVLIDQEIKDIKIILVKAINRIEANRNMDLSR